MQRTEDSPETASGLGLLELTLQGDEQLGENGFRLRRH